MDVTLLLVLFRADRGDDSTIGGVIDALTIPKNLVDTPIFHERYQCYSFGPLFGTSNSSLVPCEETQLRDGCAEVMERLVSVEAVAFLAINIYSVTRLAA